MVNVMDHLQDHNPFHTENQIDWFILGSRSEYDQYVQCKRELYSRVKGLRSDILDLDTAKIEIEENENIINSWFRFSSTKKRAAIEIKRLQGKIESLERSIYFTKKEAARFLQHLLNLETKIGTLTEEERISQDKERWVFWVKVHLVKDFLTDGKPGGVSVNHVLSLPKEYRDRVMFDIHETRRALMEGKPAPLFVWYDNQENIVPQLPDKPSSEALSLLDDTIKGNLEAYDDCNG